MSHRNRPNSIYDKEIYEDYLHKKPYGNERLFCEKNLIYESSPSSMIYLKKNRENPYILKNNRLVKPRKIANKGFYIVYKNKNPYQPKNRHFKRFLHIVNDSKNYILTRSRPMLNLRKLKSANNKIFDDNKKLRSRSFYMSRNRKEKTFLKRLSTSPLKLDRNNKNLQKIKTLIRSCSCNRRNNNLSVEYADTQKTCPDAELKNRNKTVINTVLSSTATKKKTVAFDKEKSDSLTSDTQKVTTFKRIDFVEMMISNSEKTLRLKEGITNELTNVSSDVFLQKTIVSSKKTRQINTDNLKNSSDYQNTHYNSSYYIKSKSGFSFIETSKQENSSSSQQSSISREIIQSNVSKEKTVDSAVSNFEIRSRKVMQIPRQSRLELFNRSSEKKCFILNKNFDTGSG